MRMCLSVLTVMFVATTSSRAFAVSDPPTYTGDVAEIIFDKCAVCHRPNSSGPFPLMTYADAKQHAATIEAVLDDGYMPPWKPVDHGISFANERRLSNEEMRLIKKWIDAGCLEGDPDKTPNPPMLTEGWSLGEPDMVVAMNGSFRVPAEGPDIYRSFVFPLDLPHDKWVKAVELRPRARTAVHHAIFFIDPAGNARALDGADGQPGISGMGFMSGFGEQDRRQSLLSSGRGTDEGRSKAPWLPRFAKPLPTSGSSDGAAVDPLSRGLGGYVPGATPNYLQGDLAMKLPKGSDIVMQTHFHPSGKVEVEKADLALYFAKKPSSHPIISIMIPPMFGFGAGMMIRAGDDNYRLEETFTLPVDTEAIGVAGHAHYICRKMKLEATLPKGSSKILLEIDDWDLDWQDQYQFEEPISLPAGTVLRCEIIYDNSINNPENPNVPPRDIRWGRGSTDEMGSLTLQAVAKNVEESPKLQAAVRQQFIQSISRRSNSEMVEMLLQLDDNHDGKLQRFEAPGQLNKRAFQWLDANRDEGLDAKELARLAKLRSRGRGKDIDD